MAALVPAEMADLLTASRRDAIVVPVGFSAAGRVPDDSSDEMLLACAVDIGADVIVSGDHYLLDQGT